ncbi:MAG: outer membrane beta-barrel protein [Hyphomicrobiaceae bacterium]|nr:outer membrane beta-barrel protein [Hyphomicrobiaceae bacterium]
MAGKLHHSLSGPHILFPDLSYFHLEGFMDKFFIAAAVAVLASTGAQAADMTAQTYTKARPLTPASGWSGFYAGVNVGGLFENSGTWNTNASVSPLNNAPNSGNTVAALQAATSSFQHNGTGFLGGLQAGYNFQVSPRYVVGIEADFDGSTLRSSGSTTVTALVIAGGAGANQAFQTTASGTRELDYLGTLRGRVGYLVQPDLLAFATGGLAYGGTKTSMAFNQVGLINPPFAAPAPGSASGSVDKTLVGFTIGGGLEWKLSQKWSFAAQYLYYDLGSVSVGSGALSADLNPTNFPGGGTVSVAPHTDAHYAGSVARAGVNYHF